MGSKLKNQIPVISAILTAVIFGFSFLFTKEALDILSPYQLLGFRFATAAVVLAILKLAGVIKVSFRGWNWKELLLLTLFQPILYFIFETNGVRLTTASVSGIIISLVPVAVAIQASLFLKEKPTLLQAAFILMSVSGVVIIVFAKGKIELGGQMMGIFSLLGAVITGGFYNVLSRKISIRHTPMEITFCMMWVAALVFNLISFGMTIYTGSLTEYFIPLTNVKVIGALIYLGILSSIIAFFLLNFSLSKMQASKATVFLNLVPIISVFAGVVFRNEEFLYTHVFGGLLILLGVWGTNRLTKGDSPLPTKKETAQEAMFHHSEV